MPQEVMNFIGSVHAIDVLKYCKLLGKEGIQINHKWYEVDNLLSLIEKKELK